MGNVIQQYSDITAMDIVEPVDTDGIDIPVILVLETPSVMGCGYGFEHRASPADNKDEFILYLTGGSCQDAGFGKSLF